MHHPEKRFYATYITLTPFLKECILKTLFIQTLLSSILLFSIHSSFFFLHWCLQFYLICSHCLIFTCVLVTCQEHYWMPQMKVKLMQLPELFSFLLLSLALFLPSSPLSVLYLLTFSDNLLVSHVRQNIFSSLANCVTLCGHFTIL